MSFYDREIESSVVMELPRLRLIGNSQRCRSSIENAVLADW